MEQLVFKADFSHDGRPDSTIFNHEVGDKWANQEVQSYVDDAEHSFVKDGCLVIRATPYNGKNKYASARLTTFGKVSFHYGRFVIRAKLPKGKGSWPAIWFLADDLKTSKVGWPACGEIDLMEQVGKDPETIHFSLHSKTYNHRINTQKTYFEHIDGVTDDFHDYEMQWKPGELAFLVDGVHYVTYRKCQNDTHDEWPFDKPYYLILNVAVGGFWAGPEVDDTALPFEMKIASIEYYK